ncbi:MAG: N-acetylmuramoyl-L-alanine amidase [Betaproteobacteria bacterium]|nr:N-acetylmuramoyl-L-alanine amidase [Betaproteobacteria bacterium]
MTEATLPSNINEHGVLTHKRVIVQRYPWIEREDRTLESIKAIVVHQTDSSTESSVFSSYTSKDGNKDGAGAHFLITKAGVIYQTASLKKRCNHVGRIKSKCYQIHGNDCSDKQIREAVKKKWPERIKEINDIEQKKDYPDRYPINADSVGIELVGRHINDTEYEEPTAAQQESLKWLVEELYNILSINKSNVYRHPDVSYKHLGEAAGAKWD